MSDVFFSLPCPGCKRIARKPIQYLGRKVKCRNCGREIHWLDPELSSAAELDPVCYWIEFTDQPVSEGEFGRNLSLIHI